MHCQDHPMLKEEGSPVIDTERPEEGPVGSPDGDPFQHLCDELRLLDIRLLKGLRVRQMMERGNAGGTRGLFITAEEVGSMLDACSREPGQGPDNLDTGSASIRGRSPPTTDGATSSSPRTRSGNSGRYAAT